MSKTIADGELYRRAVTIAVNNGFNFGMSSSYTKEEIIDALTIDFDSPDPYAVIFNHWFAKYFWGEADFITGDTDNYGDMIHMPRWKFNLMQLAAADNPFEYLEKFLTHYKPENIYA